MKQRIHKVLADHGHGSRRGIEQLIKKNKVEVNGKIAKIGQLVSEKDSFKIEGKNIVLSRKGNKDIRILMYNKKVGEVSTRHDPENRPTVFDNLPRLNSERWVSVGRLDVNTSGLMLFTNKGELANKLMHPSSVIEREYVARIHGLVTEKILQKLINGVKLEDGLARFTDVQEGKKGKTNQWFAMVIMEGRTREVRRLWESQNLQVSRLKRVRYGDLFLPANLKQGSYKAVSYTHLRAHET